MRRFNISIALIAFVSLFIISSCSKDDDPIDPGNQTIPDVNQDIIIPEDQFISTFVNDVNADSLQSSVEWLENMTTRFMLADNRREVAVNIKDRFIGLGYDNAIIDSFYVTRTFSDVEYSTWQYNVVAGIEGTLYPDSIIVIGAHYDNIINQGGGDPFFTVPGANDNASGVAGTMEIARLFKSKSYDSKYSMQFVLFGAEELGLWGSRHFSRKAKINNDLIKLMINFDMIGVPSSSSSSEWSVNIINYFNSKNEAKVARAICETYTDINYFTNNSSSRFSDSQSFYLDGFKPIFFTQDALDDKYHTVNDLATHMNFEYSREIVKSSCALVLYYNE